MCDECGGPRSDRYQKFDRGVTQLMHDNLHWLEVPKRVKYKVILTRRCLTAPRYLVVDYYNTLHYIEIFNVA